jgi:hypothetical protein
MNGRIGITPAVQHPNPEHPCIDPRSIHPVLFTQRRDKFFPRRASPSAPWGFYALNLRDSIF